MVPAALRQPSRDLILELHSSSHASGSDSVRGRRHLVGDATAEQVLGSAHHLGRRARTPADEGTPHQSLLVYRPTPWTDGRASRSVTTRVPAPQRPEEA